MHRLMTNKWFMKSPNGPVLRPYIKLHLYPFKAAKKKTQPIEAGTDLNPVFDNHFQFKVSFSVLWLATRTQEWHLVRIILKTNDFFRLWLPIFSWIVLWKSQYGIMRRILVHIFWVEYAWIWVSSLVHDLSTNQRPF